MKVVVVVPARDAAAGLTALLDRLAQQTVPHEVVVVDDASSDATVSVAQARGVRVVRQVRRAGSYAARNAGVAAAGDADVLAFTDADCEPRPDWLEAGLRALREADIAAGLIDVPLSPADGIVAAVDAGQFLHQARAVDQGWAATANVLVRGDAFRRAGPFDERLVSGGDAEWSSRAVARGLRLVLAEDAVVSHPPRRSARALALKAFRVGYGAGVQHRLGVGREAHALPAWRSRGTYRIYRALPGEDRHARAGITITLRHAWARLLLVQLPLALGSLVATAPLADRIPYPRR